jgi:DNA-binding CsgD family transcriptional regulator
VGDIGKGGAAVTRPNSLNTADLRQLCAAVDKSQLAEVGESMPRSVLAALRELIPCDDVTYQVMDPVREVVSEVRSLETGVDEQDAEELFWRAFRTSPACNYPQRTGDFTTVRRATDFYSDREFRSSLVSELFRVQGVRYETLVPLPPDGDIDHRILLWRYDGPDFSDRDQLLLTLLRPALAELDLALRLRQRTPLTTRQSQLLELVADGLTNRQIARQLRLSEGTVRRHLENSFERLGVRSRAAAAAHVVRLRTGAGHIVPVHHAADAS